MLLLCTANQCRSPMAAALLRHRSGDESMAGWLDRVGAGRRREALVGIGHDAAYDIADPVGRGRLDHEATAEELDHLLALLVDMAWPIGLQHGQERSA